MFPRTEGTGEHTESVRELLDANLPAPKNPGDLTLY